MVRFDLRSLFQGQTRTDKLKSAYNLLIIGSVLEVRNVKPTHKKIMGYKSFDVIGFDLGPLLQGQVRLTKLESGYNSLITGTRGLQCVTNL